MENKMKKLRLLVAAVVLTLISAIAISAQVTTTGSISGSVIDPTGALVADATVTTKNAETAIENTATTSENGTFTIPQLQRGVYRVIIEHSGFKKAEITNVKVNVGAPTTVNVTLEVGTPQETVTIIGGGEILQTQTANVGNTIVGRQIIDLPFTSRDALDLVLAMPGTQTPARPRSSTINGLPKGALNITMDGLPDQAEDSKSGDGFFTYVRPRIDAIEEVSLSSAVPGAESSGDGAVQIKFSTRGGTNEYHGSAYWYHRNTALNANYYFNNIAGQPRQVMILNQPGGRVGGPIIIPKLLKSRDRAFFFVNYEEFRLPGSTARQRNVLTPDAEKGIFTYGNRTVNLLTLAASKGQTSTIDPTIGSTLTAIRGSLSQGGLTPLGDNQQRFTWNSPADQVRKFATVRFDFNLTKNHHLDNVWNYNVFRSSPDQLNSRDAIFPGLDIGTGGQYSLRFSDSIGLRSTLRPNLINEFRAGIGTGGTVQFFPETNAGAFAPLGGFAPSFTVFNPGGNNTSSPFSGSSSSRNNAPSIVFSDNVSYVKGDHSFNFGGDYAQYKPWAQNVARVVPAITFGLNSNDPAQASGMFAAANFPGASGTDITNAQNLYALLTGRVITITASAFTNDETGKYSYLGDFVQRVRQRRMGFYAQDAWRFRPNLTINAGLRWEVQFPFTVLNDNYTDAGYAGVWGVSGVGNLFKPGTLTGSVTQFNKFPQKTHPYETDWNNLGPSVGFAWSPQRKSGLLRRLLGDAGGTVIRAGYSIAFVREGTDVMNSIIGGNPGGTLNATRSVALGNLAAGTLFRNRADLAPPPIPSSPTFPITPTSNPPYSTNDAVNAFEPHLKIGYVQSWSAGIQRELTKDTVFEARYVANRGLKLWRQFDINETNITENGFINEFKLAQQNLLLNIQHGCGNTFRYFGAAPTGANAACTGTSPLPTIVRYFSGNVNPNNATSYTSSNFTSTTFVNPLFPNNSNARTFAQSLYGDAGRRANAAAAGLASNLFVANPNLIGGGAFIVDNGGHTWYDSLQIEVRRRMSKGLLIQGSYTFSKSSSNMYASSGVVAYQPGSFRNQDLDRNVSPWDLRHAIKANWIWELPIGRGQWIAGNASNLADKLIGGWAIHGQVRSQSGSTFNFGNVQLVGMTREELQKSIEIRRDPSGIVFFLPEDIILNTRRAFNVTATGFGTLGAPSGKYIAPAGSNGCVQTFVGECGFRNLVVYGPKLNRADISIVKKTSISERVNFELRAEMLNAFNNINFKIGSQTAEATAVTNFSGATFGQTTAAYQDLSTTNDVGGRMIQIVFRINF